MLWPRSTRRAPIPLDVHFARSTDGGATWSAPVRVNDDPGDHAWQWFGTHVGRAERPHRRGLERHAQRPGRLRLRAVLLLLDRRRRDLVAERSRCRPPSTRTSAGRSRTRSATTTTWSPTAGAAHLAYAATFNGEQDVYYIRIAGLEIFADGFESGDTSAWSSTIP